MINKLMKKFGYEVVQEDEYGVYYKRGDKQFNFIHVVCVVRKASGKHIMQSYNEKTYKVDHDYIFECCGVEIPVLLLLWLKGHSLSFKYGWKWGY